MEDAISNTSNNILEFLGSSLGSLFKVTLGRSCGNACAGRWDLGCFLDKFCFLDIAELLVILLLCYLIFRIGIFQYVVKSVCKVFCAACCTIGGMVRCLWHKLTNTKRVYRGRKRLRDIEAGEYTSGDEEASTSDSLRHRHGSGPSKRGRSFRNKYSHHHHRDSNGHHRSSNSHLVTLPSKQISERVGGKTRRARSGRKMNPAKTKE